MIKCFRGRTRLLAAAAAATTTKIYVASAETMLREPMIRQQRTTYLFLPSQPPTTGRELCTLRVRKVSFNRPSALINESRIHLRRRRDIPREIAIVMRKERPRIGSSGAHTVITRWEMVMDGARGTFRECIGRVIKATIKNARVIKSHVNVTNARQRFISLISRRSNWEPVQVKRSNVTRSRSSRLLHIISMLEDRVSLSAAPTLRLREILSLSLSHSRSCSRSFFPFLSKDTITCRWNY